MSTTALGDCSVGEQSPFSKLSPRQMDVLSLSAWHRCYKEIAEELGISVGTVNSHVVAIKRKTHMDFDDLKRLYIEVFIARRDVHQ